MGAWGLDGRMEEVGRMEPSLLPLHLCAGLNCSLNWLSSIILDGPPWHGGGWGKGPRAEGCPLSKSQPWAQAVRPCQDVVGEGGENAMLIEAPLYSPPPTLHSTPQPHVHHQQIPGAFSPTILKTSKPSTPSPSWGKVWGQRWGGLESPMLWNPLRLVMGGRASPLYILR